MINPALKSLVLKFKPVIKTTLCMFYDKKYITGKHFDTQFSGYRYALKSIWLKNILHLSKTDTFPTALTCYISNSKNIHFHPNDLNNFQSPGTYFQNFNANIYIGEGSYIAPNVGIITSNHNIKNPRVHENGLDVVLGRHCWIGMNSVILPGVVLGDNTVVAAGSVVTKSFKEGGVVIGGVPAKIIKIIT